MTTFLIIGGIALLIGAFLALDWWLAGRTSKRAVNSNRDGQIRNSAVDEHIVDRLAQNHRDSTHG